MNAAAFAAEWIEAWNAHDLNRILALYAEDVVLVSPKVGAILGEPSGTVRGKAMLRDYFSRGLARLPDITFVFEAVYAGLNSVVVRYKSYDGRGASEAMVFGTDGLVREVRAHYLD